MSTYACCLVPHAGPCFPFLPCRALFGVSVERECVIDNRSLVYQIFYFSCSDQWQVI